MRGSLDKDTIMRAFEALSERLQERAVKAHVYIVGGAAMILAHRRSQSTLDVDALLIDEREAVLGAAREVARDHRLPVDWLNDEVRKIPVLPGSPDKRAMTLFGSPHLVVTGASAQHMLAMKVRAGRNSDEADIKFLLRMLDVRTLRQLRAIHSAVFPHDGIPWRKEAAVADLIRQLWGDDPR